MSLSVKKLLDWLVTCCVPITLLISGSIAGWKGVHDPVDNGPRIRGIPVFDFLIPEFAGYQPTQDVAAGVIQKEPFLGGTGAPVVASEDEPLDLQEIQLGMIVVSGEVRLCLTNGRIMSAGHQESRFTIEQISEQGVWYTTARDRFFLTVGDKVNIKTDGTVIRFKEDAEKGKHNDSTNNI